MDLFCTLIFKKALDKTWFVVLILLLLVKYADVAELVDALVLGTSANGVGVQVPSSAPMTFLFKPIEQIDTKINQ